MPEVCSLVGSCFGVFWTVVGLVNACLNRFVCCVGLGLGFVLCCSLFDVGCLLYVIGVSC